MQRVYRRAAWAGGALGATYMDPKAPDASPETRFSISFGGGAKFFFSDHIGIRLEGRIYATFVDSSGGVFCGGCSFGDGGNALWQGEANAGLIIAF